MPLVRMAEKTESPTPELLSVQVEKSLPHVEGIYWLKYFPEVVKKAQLFNGEMCLYNLDNINSNMNL